MYCAGHLSMCTIADRHEMNQEDYIARIYELGSESCFSKHFQIDEDEEFCPLDFNLLCWNYTKLGARVNQSCNSEFTKSSNQGLVFRQCSQNGTWMKIDYSQCRDFTLSLPSEDLQMYSWLSINYYVSYFGYALSVLSLISAITIFVGIKRLHCARNHLHVHLFTSFLFRALMYFTHCFVTLKFIDNSTQKEDSIFKNENYTWICKALNSIKFYAFMCNFLMILMEGLYLHNLIYFNLFSDRNGISLYAALGWGLPILFILPWMWLSYWNDIKNCWSDKTNISLLIDIPINISVLINFVLFLIILRVLFRKLNSTIQEKKVKYRKLLKSTLILIPLFGVPYIISFGLNFYAKDDITIELVFIFFDQTASAFQGFFAATIYCLMNSEVQTELRRKYSSMKDRHDKEFRRSRTISHTQQFSIPFNEDGENLQNFSNKKDSSNLNQKACIECHF